MDSLKRIKFPCILKLLFASIVDMITVTKKLLLSWAHRTFKAIFSTEIQNTKIYLRWKFRPALPYTERTSI